MLTSKGFTLMEILITVAIVGLLAAIALPSYQASIRRSNRADAQITLSKLATLEEQYYFRSNQYTGDFADIVNGATTGQPIDSDEEHYSIALTGGGTTWSMTATAQGVQANDTDCASLTLTSLGNKTALDSSNAASTECW